MKRLFILTICMLVSVSMFSQTVTLSFTGRGSGGVVTEERYQQIDSLKISDITRQWEQMIYYPDTVVLLEALAVPMLNVKQSGLEQNVPNPFNCVTEAMLNLYEGGNVTLQVFDAGGREYLSYNGKLPAGEHLFEITLAIPQTYFLTAVASTGRHMVKMVNLGSCGVNSMVLKSSSDITVSSKAVVANEFDLGDEMEYQAYTTYNNIVFDATLNQVQNDSEDITIHFNIPYCRYTMNVDKRYGCDFYELNGVTYYESTSRAATLNLTSAGGCDSVVVIDVIIDHPTRTEESITACQSTYWNEISCTTTGDYVAELISRGGCDSIVTLHFNRVDSIVNHIYESDCYSATWNGETFYETGDYVRHFQTQYWCDSIVHFHFTNLTDDVVDVVHACDQFTWINGRTYYGNNDTDTVHLINQHGCDSIVRLNLTLNRTGFTRVDRLACGQFEFYGHTYTTSGTYTETLDNPYTGCDSIIELHLTVINDTIVDIFEDACDSFIFEGQTYTQSGVYDIHHHPNNYCDSIVRLHLNIGHSTYSYQTEVACDSFTWFGEEYTSSGTYEHTIPFSNSNGCDSIIRLNLTINHSVTSDKTINACREYNLNGERITESCTRVVTYTAVNGCDSTVTYTINIFGDIQTEFTQYACGSFQWNGETFNASGDYERHVTPVLYCDSTVTMHLFIGSPDNIEDVQAACDSYVWQGQTYNTSGTYTKTLTNIYGCDSVVTLRLTINDSYNVTDTREACDSYEWEGTTYTTSGSYTKTLHSVHGCDSVVTLNLTVKYSVEHELWDTAYGPFDISEGSIYDVFRTTYLDGRYDTLGPKIWNDVMYTQSGNFQQTFTAANGCDSIVTLHLVYHERVYDTRDGNTYLSMEYGNQVWTTENMKYLPEVHKDRSSTEPKYYVYGYAPSGTPNVGTAHNRQNYTTYGVLYNYPAAAQTACPEGWHLPSQSEWETLVTYLGAHGEYCGTNTANVAKSMAANELWSSSGVNCAVGNNMQDNNSSAFNGKPGGYLGSGNGNITTNSFAQITKEANWWTSTSGQRALIKYDSPSVVIESKALTWGFSVRCVKD